MIRSWNPLSRRTEPAQARVLMVCLGNICRSPTAEAVLRSQLQAGGWGTRIAVDSAGTHAERGHPPDPRAQAVAARRGYDLSALRSRPMARDDFEHFELVLAMDQDNLEWLRRRCPPPLRHRLGLLLAVGLPGQAMQEVPDPYFGGADGFECTLDLIEQACRGLVVELDARRLSIPCSEQG